MAKNPTNNQTKLAQSKNYKSEIAAAMHEMMSGFHEAGVVPQSTMSEFDGLCLTSDEAPIVLESQANLSALLEQARREGKVRIQRADGEIFILKAECNIRSPLDVEGVDLAISANEIVEFIHEGRKQT